MSALPFDVLLDTTAAIATPERVRFRHRIAGPGPRAAAWVVDLTIQGTLLTVVVSFLSVFAVVGLEEFGGGLMLLVVFFLQWSYGAFFETLMSGKTPGKYLFNLRVVTDTGAPGRFPQFVLRNLLKGADFLPVGYGVGVLAMTLDDRMRRLGDMVAGTVVVDENAKRLLGGVVIQPPVDEEERRALPPRVDLAREEIAVIEEFLRRRQRMSNERAEELAELLAPVLSEQLGITADSAERVVVLAYARATGRDRVLDGG